MAEFTAADIKRVRELTGAGMMDFKKALDEADGDNDKAVELLRIKGAKDVGKRAERPPTNGLVAAEGGAMIELDCETDFVAKSERVPGARRQDRRSRRSRIRPADVEALLGESSTAHGRRRGRGAQPDRREARAAPGGRLRRQGRDLPAPPRHRPAARDRRAGRV